MFVGKSCLILHMTDVATVGWYERVYVLWTRFVTTMSSYWKYYEFYFGLAVTYANHVVIFGRLENSGAGAVTDGPSVHILTPTPNTTTNWSTNLTSTTQALNPCDKPVHAGFKRQLLISKMNIMTMAMPCGRRWFYIQCNQWSSELC